MLCDKDHPARQLHHSHTSSRLDESRKGEKGTGSNGYARKYFQKGEYIMTGFENFIYHFGAWTLAGCFTAACFLLVGWVERMADRAYRRKHR